ncbi:FtsQ-type POTRA domain-containing protein [uncultured Microbacterium sp.]|uniref:FtsQ-type POTRA domain-containing protein n=2 Tax=uncultured Microbacterium sp. TaxID=191216 RepID=UPI002619390C|nr:FtsQ-type POTRA domain-containing protein [uncultured Microbacterium sp.]
MRRPSPLPQPERSARERPSAPTGDDEAIARVLGRATTREPAPALEDEPESVAGPVIEPRTGDIASDDATVSDQTTDVIAYVPFDEPTTKTVSRGPDEAGITAVAAPEPVEDTIGPLDIWRAARARRRALRGEVRRFTVRSRRRRTAWIVAGALVVALVVGTVGAAYSPLFAVERIEVVGTSALPADQVAAALSGQIGTPLALVDDSAVKQALVAFPLVESYTLQARPPHDLVVRIVERTPIGAVQSDAGWSVVDAAGVVLSTTPDRPAGTAAIAADGGLSSPAFTAIAEVMRALPASIRSQVTDASATGRDDVTLRLGDAGAKVVWGSVDKTPLKAALLESAMTAKPAGSVSCYDVSSPDVLVVCAG